MFALNLRLISQEKNGKLRVHNSIQSRTLTFQDVIKPKPVLEELNNDFIDLITKSSIETPNNPMENMTASNLEHLAEKIREGTIKESFVSGHESSDGSYIIQIKLEKL